MVRQHTIRFFFLFFFFLAASVHAQQSVNIDSSVQVKIGKSVYKKSTKISTSSVSIKNITKSTITGPLWLVATSINKAGITLVNAQGQTFSGLPFVSVPLPTAGLRAGKSTSRISLQFSNPSGASFTFTVSVFAGVSPANVAPVANAGPDQTTFVQQTVNLDGGKSSDANGSALTYSWSFVSRPQGSSAALVNPTSVNPTFVADKFGDYVIQLIVNDGVVDSAPDTLKISTLNSPPVANAGANQTAWVGDTIVLDGSGSTDVDGNSLTYSWSFVSKPQGSSAVLANPSGVKPSFTIDIFGDYLVQLTVNDGTVDSNKPSTVTISTLNSPPVANAGPDQSPYVGDTVQLNGSGSTDVDGNQLTFTWSLLSKPQGSTVTLFSTAIVNPTFTVDLPGSYVIQLIVNDGTVNGKPDTVTIATQNRPPLANAGPDQSVAPNATVQLDGSASSDPDKDPLTFNWSILSKPQGSGATLSDPTAVKPTFSADLPGNYVGQLIVNDGKLNSSPDTVNISTENSTPIADAGPDQTIHVGATVQLDSSQSYDPDGSSLFYFWSLTTKPEGSNATVSDPSAATPTFLADIIGTYVAQLMVGDGLLISSPDTVMITATNQSPVAQDDTGTTTANTPVLINVLANDSDPDGDPLTVTSVTQGANGKAEISPKNTVTYTPGTGFTGSDTFTYSISDGHGGTASATIRVTVNPLTNQQPVAQNDNATTGVGVAVQINVLTNDSDPDGDPLTVISYSQGSNGTVVCLSNGTCTYTPNAGFSGLDTFTYTASDGRGGQKTATVNIEVTAADATITAPPLDVSVATTIGTATNFLYTGANPVQTGVAPGTIVTTRAAVIRGKVITRDGNALPGVTVTILNHPEFGQTITRSNGYFDMAINGGGPLTINYAAAGFLPVQRQVDVSWQDYVIAADVTLIPLDAQLTIITPNAPVTQFHRSSLTTDADGSRSATLLFSSGTTAQLVMPDGSTQPLNSLNVRATEYSVGPNGPKAMPGDLPPTSGYTYAVEYSVDQALVAGARSVIFNQAVITYTENFLGFSVGTVVPAGYYDRLKGGWIPAPNGRVIKILSIVSGLANVDTTGGNLPDNGVALGMTAAERQQLALLYTAGQSLWRVPVIHFSAWDFNWPFGPPSDAHGPGQPAPKEDKDPCEDCNSEGSIIGSQSQTLGEALQITGTPFRMHYLSERTAGRKRTLDIPLSGATYPASLKRIDLEISVAGRKFAQSFQVAPNLRYLFIWDGQDAYGRSVQGETSATVRIGYVYDGVYLLPSQKPGVNYDALFGHYSYFGTPVSASATRREVTLWQESHSLLGGAVFHPKGLGGWSLSPQHVYDATARILYLGDGTRRDARILGGAITTVAGNGTLSFSGDGGPATLASMSNMNGVAVAPDGSFYIADTGNYRIRQVTPNGIISTVAGNGTGLFSGDGGPATQAGLFGAVDVAVASDGSLYIADNSRIRRVGPDGVITTVAGNGTFGFSGDGGPATLASFNGAFAVAVAPDGSFYIADDNNNRIRRVGPDGIITTVAGNGTSGFSGDGGPATLASLSAWAVAVAPDGGFYIADTRNNRIRRVTPDGIITTVAGNGTSTFSGDGGPAIQAGLYFAVHAAVASDGSLLIADGTHIRRVTPNGIITSVAGNGTIGFGGDGGPARAANLAFPNSVAVAPDGSFYIADTENYRIRRVVVSTMPGVSFGDITIPSEDGEEIYVFSASASDRHVLTFDALTGAVRYQFGYNGANQLVSITDGDGNITTIERDGSGNPTAIVAPGGQRTTFILDSNGYLATVANPANERVQFSYTADGLLLTHTDPRGGLYRYNYDTVGRLIKDEDPAGGAKTLTRVENSDGYTVTVTTALGRATSYQVQNLPTGGWQRVTTDPSGLRTIEQIGTDGSRTIIASDGMVMTQVLGPDPRFGMQSPITKTLTVSTPGGLKSTITSSRTATLTDPNNPLSLKTLTDTASINGRTYTSLYDAATRTLTDKTPLGRQSTMTIDAQGRPVQLQVAGLEAMTFMYDARGRIATMTTGSGVDVRRLTFSYNSDGYVQTIADPVGRTVDYAYDSAGRVIQQILPGGRVTGYVYDGNGNITTITPPARPAHEFSFTPVDLTSAYIPPDVGAGTNKTLYAYSADRQLTQVSRPDGQTVDFGYDSAGRLNALTFPDGVFNYTYDPTKGDLKTIGAPGGIGLTYTYDGPLLTSTTWTGPVSGSVSRTYDNNFRTTALAVGGTSISFSYDNDSLLTQAGTLSLSRSAQSGLLTGTALGGATDTRIYNGFGESTSYAAAYGGLTLFEQQYTRDKLGRITQKTETIGGLTEILGYSYDVAGRLTTVTRNGVTSATYAYDSNGNRLTFNNTGGTITGSYDQQDRLLQYGAATYAYTANGELLSKTVGGQTTTYQYDALGNLMAVALPSGTRITYLVDGNNRRAGKQVNGTLTQGFLYQDNLKPVAELDGSNNVVSRFVYATRSNVPDYMTKGGVTYRIFTDHLGSPRLVVDVATGSVVQRMDYDEFGQVLNDTNPGFQPFGFAGGLYDRNARLVRFGARDYDAETGHWTSKDPIDFAGGDANLYAYVIGDPINLKDPGGLDMDLNLIPSNSPKNRQLIANLEKVHDPDYFTVAVHANAKNFYGRDGKKISVKDLAALIRKNRKEGDRRVIRLYACNANANSQVNVKNAATQLSGELFPSQLSASSTKVSVSSDGSVTANWDIVPETLPAKEYPDIVLPK